MSVIADEATVTGFLLTGIGQRTHEKQNYMIVGKETTDAEIETFFTGLCNRKDIGIIFISQSTA